MEVFETEVEVMVEVAHGAD
ncbi:hypothetical protein CCACVL1_18613 [Corchorus capsularis]|nr:hypothetical protein CCACVL1_18613 [Corchorus capsularis]